jgi:hypothetical protein
MVTFGHQTRAGVAMEAVLEELDRERIGPIGSHYAN